MLVSQCVFLGFTNDHHPKVTRNEEINTKLQIKKFLVSFLVLVPLKIVPIVKCLFIRFLDFLDQTETNLSFTYCFGPRLETKGVHDG